MTSLSAVQIFNHIEELVQKSGVSNRNSIEIPMVVYSNDSDLNLAEYKGMTAAEHRTMIDELLRYNKALSRDGCKILQDGLKTIDISRFEQFHYQSIQNS